MVQGTMSGAGKSLLCTALCRIFAQDGWRVAPFKSQNMALNSYVTADGLEMGRAQVVQAQAAGREPDVRMNPILLKPCSDTGSQVIVNGEVRGNQAAAEYFRHKKELIPEIMAAYNSLAAENDIVVIEGAGSPAEINLKADDIVNMGLAALVDAPVLLAGDIDRGGVFAQLYGTVALLTPEERGRIKGLLINKFRGDPEILRPGLAMLEEKTGCPVLGVIPYLAVAVDDEDSLAPCLGATDCKKPVDIAVVRLPRISNFTDFAPLDAHPALGVRYVGEARALGNPDLIILPGTKSTMADLLWLRQSGLEAALQKLAAAGVPVLGVCGGYQMLGTALCDPTGAEGGGSLRGLGLLPVQTQFSAHKTRAQVQATVQAKPLAGAAVAGYEIHTGITTRQGGTPFATVQQGGEDGCVVGNVCGTYLHGLFDTGALTAKLAAWLCARKGIACQTAAPISHAAYQQQQFDTLADGVRAALNIPQLYEMMGVKQQDVQHTASK
ncbi:MAG: cobyric acid synthase [Gemmiger sp.]|nr:cobyric acid synthase [Gemmiger sp.]